MLCVFILWNTRVEVFFHHLRAVIISGNLHREAFVCCHELGDQAQNPEYSR